MLGTVFFYNLIVLSSTFFVYFSEKCKYRFDRNILLFIAFLIITIPAALRYQIGIDYKGYLNVYTEIASNLTSHVEIGFYTLTKLLIILNLDPQWLFICTSIIIYGILLKSYPKKNAYVIHFFFMAFFYLSSYTFIRSYIVFSISVLAILTYIQNKGKIQFIMLLIIAGLFHKSAFFLIPIVLFDNPKILKSLRKVLLPFFILLIIIFIFRYPIVSNLIDLPIIDILGYRNYLDSEHFFRETEIGSGLGVIFKIFILISPLFFLRTIISSHPQYTILIVLNLFALAALFLSLTYFIFSRVHYAFYPAYILTPYLMLNLIQSNLKKNDVSNAMLFFMIIGIFVLFQKEIIDNQSHFCKGHRVTPYVSIFNKEDDKSLKIPAKICLPKEEH